MYQAVSTTPSGKSLPGPPISQKEAEDASSYFRTTSDSSGTHTEFIIRTCLRRQEYSYSDSGALTTLTSSRSDGTLIKKHIRGNQLVEVEHLTQSDPE